MGCCESNLTTAFFLKLFQKIFKRSIIDMICLISYEVDSKNSLGWWDIVTSFYIPIYD